MAEERVDRVMSWLRDAIVPLYVENEKPQKRIQQVRRQNRSTALGDAESFARVYLKLIEKKLEQYISPSLISMPKARIVNGADDNSDVDNSDCFQSLVVMEFSSIKHQDDVLEILNQVHGRGLQTISIKSDNQKILKVHITASVEKLLKTAEKMKLKKLCRNKKQGMRDFTIAGLNQGIFKNSENLECFLTTAEKQRLILFELEAIRRPPPEQHLEEAEPDGVLRSGLLLFPGFEKTTEEALLPRWLREGIITDLYPLHCHPETLNLNKTWVSAFFKRQPLDEIRNYFGETIAMYFAFLGYYTYYLIPPAVFGVLSNTFMSAMNENVVVPLFCVFNVVWATVFLESWKQRTAELAFRWGTLGMEKFEEPRAAFYGLSVMKDPVTNRLLPYYPKSRRRLKLWLVSFPVMTFVLIVAFFFMLFYFWLDAVISDYIENSSIPYIISSLIMLLPTVVYALLLQVLTTVYRRLAFFLNDWENHRIQSAYDNHLVVKLLSLNFANYFMSLFYVAFYLQDTALLRQHLATLLITMQLVQQFQECLLPYILYKLRKVKIVRNLSVGNDSSQNAHESNISPDTLLYAERDAVKLPYESTLEDYLEMCLQFGYVFFFSAVFPTAAFWALMNNLIEIRSDAFKLCRTLKRSFAQPAASIGVWAAAFEIMSVVAVITNCALFALSPSLEHYWTTYGSMNVTLCFFAAEHFLLFTKLALQYLIPDVPNWVRVKLAAAEYQAKLLRDQAQTGERRTHSKIE